MPRFLLTYGALRVFKIQVEVEAETEDDAVAVGPQDYPDFKDEGWADCGFDENSRYLDDCWPVEENDG